VGLLAGTPFDAVWQRTRLISETEAAYELPSLQIKLGILVQIARQPAGLVTVAFRSVVSQIRSHTRSAARAAARGLRQKQVAPTSRDPQIFWRIGKINRQL